MSDPMTRPARIAVISLHTSPLDQPGSGDSGGMNVEIRALFEGLSERGVAVDAFTRCAGRGVPEVEQVGSLTRVIQVPAGPCAPVAKGSLPGLLPSFVDAVIARAEAEGPYDLIHAHYWLSGRAAAAAKARWGVPLVVSFHTLGEVKNLATGAYAAEPEVRLEGEREAIIAADRILAPTALEAENLAALYGAHGNRVRVVPPGVDPEEFRPQDRRTAAAALGLSGRVVMFLGRLQRLKGPDVAIRAVAEALRLAPGLSEDLTMAVVGGPSGEKGDAYVARLRAVAAEEGIGDRVRFLDPRPHEKLPTVYPAAEVLVAPSRTESFGLAALEAQACGVPVVAAGVGGLRTVVEHGRSGFLVDDHDPRAFAERLVEILGDPDLASRLSAGAREHALDFSWDQTITGILDAYGELVPGVAALTPV
jgi:D-inositol-3-phosphate glycosyltransferase